VIQSYYPRSSVLPFQVLFVGKKRGKGAIATRLIDKDEIVIHDEQPLASGQVLINKVLSTFLLFPLSASLFFHFIL
jgi:hypothetical protein